MGAATSIPDLDEALERIEETILPTIGTMLDSLLDAASLARPGIDAAAYAAELGTVALQLRALTRQVEALCPTPIEAYAAASDLRMSA